MYSTDLDRGALVAKMPEEPPPRSLHHEEMKVDEDLLLPIDQQQQEPSPSGTSSTGAADLEFLSVVSTTPGALLDDDGEDVEMASGALMLSTSPTAMNVDPLTAVSVDPMSAMTVDPMTSMPPPLPEVDYHHRRTPVPTWSPLEPGLEAEGEVEIVLPITGWNDQLQDILSPPIEFCGFSWQLMVLPRGTDDVRGRAVSVFVKAQPVSLESDLDWHICARLQLVLRNPLEEQSSVQILKHTQHRFEPSASDWGFSTFTTPKCMLKGDGSTGNRPILHEEACVALARIQVIRDPTGNLWHNFINYDSKKATGFVGLLNQGATCYMNSLLQSLYQTNLLRKATFKIPTEGDKATGSIALALQRTFYRLQTSKSPVGTTELTKSFGWDSIDSFMQHDVHEFNRVLLDELESRMKKTEAEGMIEKIFTGRLKNVRKCLEVPFESAREEDFYDIQLTIRGMKNLEESFEAYIKPEYLTGDNKYHTEEHGYQDAKMFSIFERFPPVLHLHLERYTFDPMTGNTIKINDRFAFPTRINLDKYLSETADRSIPQDYTLHSVLVHGGDSHGGHYFVFIKSGDRWFKFDDTKVIQVTEKEAVDDNFGVSPDDDQLPYQASNFSPDGELIRLPSFTRMQRIKKVTNAYMLVYIRDADFSEIMSPVKDEDVPAYINSGIRQDEVIEEKRRTEKYEMLNALHVSLFTDEALRSYTGPDVFNLTNRALQLSNYESFRAKKSDTVGEFKAMVAEQMDWPLESIRLWSFANRRNLTCRLDAPLLDDEKSLGQLSRQLGQLNLYAEHASETSLPEISKETIFILIKYFDRPTGTLVPIGHFHVQLGDTIESAVPIVSPYLPQHGDDVQMDEGGDDAIPWEFYEEVKPSKIEGLIPSVTFANARFSNGDILLLQRRSLHGEIRVLEYFDFISTQVMVQLKPFHEDTGSKKRSSDDVSIPSGGPQEFQFIANLRQPFEELLAEVSRNYRNADPANIRLHLQDPKTERFWPMKSLPRPGLDIYQALVTASPLNLPPKEAITELTFAVEILPISLLELDNMKPLSLHLQGFPGINEADSTEVYAAFDATLGEFLQSLSTPYQALLESGSKYRLIEVLNHKIASVLEMDDMLAALPDHSEVYLSRIDPEAEADDDRLINVFRFWREPTRTHSVPFVFPLRKDEQWSQTRQRLLSTARLPETAVSFISFGLARPLPDTEVLYSRVNANGGRVAQTEALAIEIPEAPHGTPKLAANPEKSIKIRSSTPNNN